MNKKIRAFTLVELLTVIAIIGILAAILIPTLGKVREAARLSTCLGRQRALGQAFALYLNDNKNRFPLHEGGGRQWVIHLMEYVGPWKIARNGAGVIVGAEGGNEVTDTVYRSPLFRDPTQDNVGTGGAGTFGYNRFLFTKGGVVTVIAYDQLVRPSGFPVLATSQGDVGGGFILASGGPSPRARELGYEGGVDNAGPAPNYGRKAGFLFADWHVEARDVCNPEAWPWDDPSAAFRQDLPY